MLTSQLFGTSAETQCVQKQNARTYHDGFRGRMHPDQSARGDDVYLATCRCAAEQQAPKLVFQHAIGSEWRR